MFTTTALLLVLTGAVGIFLAMPGRHKLLHRLALLPLAFAGGVLTGKLVKILPGGGERVAFCVLALIALGGAVRVITHSRPVYSALYFILVIIASAGLMILAQAEFLAAAIVVIYAGAILVTYVFVIMLAQQSGPAIYDAQAREPFLGIIAGFALLAVLSNGLTAKSASAEAGAQPAAIVAAPAGYGQTLALGTSLMTDYVVGLQMAGVLLLASMVGAIAVAQRPALELEDEEAD